MQKLYTLKEAAQMLSISPISLYRYSSKGKIPYIKIGSLKMFTEEILTEFISQNTIL